MQREPTRESQPPVSKTIRQSEIMKMKFSGQPPTQPLTEPEAQGLLGSFLAKSVLLHFRVRPPAYRDETKSRVTLVAKTAETTSPKPPAHAHPGLKEYPLEPVSKDTVAIAARMVPT